MTYRFRGIPGKLQPDGTVTWSREPCECQLVCEANGRRTLRTVIVYRVLTGPETGRCFVCGRAELGSGFARGEAGG